MHEISNVSMLLRFSRALLGKIVYLFYAFCLNCCSLKGGGDFLIFKGWFSLKSKAWVSSFDVPFVVNTIG